jgi:putative DNA methylase
MIPKECKRLAEVDFPIAEVSRHAVHEKSIRHGLPSNLHLWWARRPLASTRAVLLALLLPDPCDPQCPTAFNQNARRFLQQVQGDVGSSDTELQRGLLKFIADFASWDLAGNQSYIEVSRSLVKAAHGDEPPLVVDPFAGGGSIPLEALRVGCEAFAGELNPVACLILRVLLEDIPRRGPIHAEEVRDVCREIRAETTSKLGALYPPDADGAKPIAYLWARTVVCESPNCGAEIPLMRTLWLCNKARRRRALRVRVERSERGAPRIEVEIFEPRAEKDVGRGTVSRAKATCIACGTVLPPDRVCSQLASQRGGADPIFDTVGRRTGGARLLAVVTLRHGEPGRHYRLPTDADLRVIHRAHGQLHAMIQQWERSGRTGQRPVPDELLPPVGTLGFRIQRYGMLEWGDLFTARQKMIIQGLVEQTAAKSPSGMHATALAIGKLLDLSNALCAWMPEQECPSAVFKLGRVKMSWDFVEGCPLSDSSGSYEVCAENLSAGIVAANTLGSGSGQVIQAMAQKCPVPDDSTAVWFTDPPYYNAIPYADLSDFFLVWMKRIPQLKSLLFDPFNRSNPLSPKDQEAVQDDSRLVDGRPKDASFFEEVMRQAFAEGERTLHAGGIGAVVFAHKTTEGWEALLSGMIRGRWIITGSWPIATEMGHRLRARESAALATSVHLICRPRSETAPVGDWSGVLRELPNRVGDWMDRLQDEGVRGADLVFACIGPALEIFSRYSKVETADGQEVTLGQYLEKVWEVVGRSALEQVLGSAEGRARNGGAGALEEDARLTALFLWTLQSTSDDVSEDGEDDSEEMSDDIDEEGDSSNGKAKGFTLVFDVVRRFAQPLGIELPKWDGRVIEMKKGVVRLLPIAERAQQLFGDDGAQAVATRLEREALTPNPLQGILFPDLQSGAPAKRGRGKRGGAVVSDETLAGARQATTLDRVHAAMLLQSSGRTNALRALLKSEQERSPDFLRLANALSALYPKGTEEKRLLDAMLLATSRSGRS